VTALGKLFRATAFRLALAILLLSAVGAGIVLTVIAWQVVSVVDREIAQTIDAEAKGLIDTFDTGAYAPSAPSSRRASANPAPRSTC
jgi:hypothetical protein